MGNVRVVCFLNASRFLEHGSSHIEGPSAVLGTSLNYCAIRILGISAYHPVAVKARSCLHKMGRFILRLPLYPDSFLVSPQPRYRFGRTRLGQILVVPSECI